MKLDWDVSEIKKSGVINELIKNYAIVIYLNTSRIKCVGGDFIFAFGMIVVCYCKLVQTWFIYHGTVIH